MSVEFKHTLTLMFDFRQDTRMNIRYHLDLYSNLIAWFVLRNWWSKVAGNCFGKRMALDNLHATEMRKANDEAMEKMDGQEKCLDDRNQREGLLIYLRLFKYIGNYCKVL